MAVNRGLWVPINTGNVGTTDLEARLADVGLFESNNGTDARSGVLPLGGANMVTGNAGPTLRFTVAPATFVVGRTVGEGVYRFSASGSTTVDTTAAPVSGSRIDVIWVKQNDHAKADPNNLAVVGVTQGGASGTPVAPSIPAGALELAQAVITSTTTATNTASITQTYRHAALRGAAIPVRNVTERAEITAPRLGQRAERRDFGAGYEDLWDGAAWRHHRGLRHAEFTGSFGVDINQLWGVGPLARDAAKTKPLSTDTFFSSPANDAVTLPEPGSYSYHARLRLSAPVGAGQTVWASLRDAPAGNEIDSLDFLEGKSAGTISVPNQLVTAASQVLYLRLWSTQSGLTVTSRIIVEKNT